MSRNSNSRNSKSGSGIGAFEIVNGILTVLLIILGGLWNNRSNNLSDNTCDIPRD